MRSFLFFALYGLIATALQNTWLSGDFFFGVHINLLLPVVLFAGLNMQWSRAIPILIFLGLLTDLSTHSPLGISSFTYCIIYSFITLMSSFITIDTFVSRFVWLAVVSFMDKFFRGLFLYLLRGDEKWFAFVFKNAPFQAIADALLGVFIVGLFIKLSSSLEEAN
ncbi:MAG: hypothetical protein ABIE74_08505 [Pseudomonadota bacterium]